jgi:hypothetical protein
MRSWLIILPMLLMGTAVFAQQAGQQEADCQTLMTEAENDFAAGKFYGIPTLLQGCLDRGEFSREERIRVFMLLTQVYLLTDDPANAEASYLKLLQADPEYVASEAVDAIDVVYLSKKFTTTPVFTPHFRIGPNFSTQSVIHPNTAIADRKDVKTNPKGGPGVSLGAGIEWNINDNLGIGTELSLSYRSFSRQVTGAFGADEIKALEHQFWGNIPLYVRYGYHLGKVRPYAYAGYSVGLLFGDLMNDQFVDKQGNEGQTPVAGPTRNVMYRRQVLNGSLLFGGGIKYKWGKNFLLFDVRYMKGLTDVVNQKTNYYDGANTFNLSESFSRYAYVDPLFKVNSYTLSFGFVRPLYDPRRVAQVRTKGVFKKRSKK